MNYTILFVDDEPANLRMLERLFRDTYNVITAASAADGLAALAKHDISLIISDQRMPGMTGIEFLKQAAEMRQQTVRIILTGYTDVSDLVDAINSGVIYKYITKPWINSDLRQTIQRAIEHYETTKNHHLMKLLNTRLENRTRDTVKAFVDVVGEMISMKDPAAYEHCRRTSNYAGLIGKKCDLSPTEMEELTVAALLHEAPNMMLPVSTESDRTSWTPEEYRNMRNRYEIGLKLLAGVPDLADVATTIAYQHERYDGKGFFDGLDGDKIPFNSRILAVANAFDELNSGRNPGLICTDEEAAEWLRARAGTEFDPVIVEKCLTTNLYEPMGFPSASRAASLFASQASFVNGL